MIHVTERLSERGITISERDILTLCQGCKQDSAIILCQCDNKRVSDGYIGSNGDNVILIVRDRRPVTIMFRRSNQPMTPQALRVESVINRSV